MRLEILGCLRGSNNNNFLSMFKIRVSFLFIVTITAHRSRFSEMYYHVLLQTQFFFSSLSLVYAFQYLL